MSRAPWSAIPAARSSAPVLRIRFALIVILLLLSSVMGIVASFAWFSAPKATAPLEYAGGLAQIVADDYVNGIAPPASLVNPVGSAPNFTSSTWHSIGPVPATPAPIDFQLGVVGSGPSAQIIETHRYLVVAGNKAYDLTVQINVTHLGNEFLADTPTLSAATQ